MHPFLPLLLPLFFGAHKQKIQKKKRKSKKKRYRDEKRGAKFLFDDAVFDAFPRTRAQLKREGLRDDANDARMIQREKREDKIRIHAFLGFDYSFFVFNSPLLRALKTRAHFLFFFLFFLYPVSPFDFRWGGDFLRNGEKKNHHHRNSSQKQPSRRTFLTVVFFAGADFLKAALICKAKAIFVILSWGRWYLSVCDNEEKFFRFFSLSFEESAKNFFQKRFSFSHSSLSLVVVVPHLFFIIFWSEMVSL